MGETRHIQLLLLAGILVPALALGAGGVVLAQAQPQIMSQFVAGGLPVADPQAALWEAIPATEVPLTAQAAVKPTLPQPSVTSIKVRSANDGQWIAFLLEWKDATNDKAATKPDQFRDAAAIQFPVDTKTPGACMGVRGKPVNLWHWKADWQDDIDTGFKDVMDAYPNFYKDYYPFAVGTPPFKMPADFNNEDARRFLVGWSVGNPLSDPLRVTPVEEMAALGFGTATHRTEQNVLGRGVWADGTYRVVYARPMSSTDPKKEPETVQFKPGGKAFAAFAVWNGANQEVGARKQLTADVTVSIQPAPGAGGEGVPWWVVLVVGGSALAIGAGAVYGYTLLSRRPKASAP